MSDQDPTKYFDLYTNGLGYLNRVREVTPKAGSPCLPPPSAGGVLSLDLPDGSAAPLPALRAGLPPPGERLGKVAGSCEFPSETR